MEDEEDEELGCASEEDGDEEMYLGLFWLESLSAGREQKNGL